MTAIRNYNNLTLEERDEIGETFFLPEISPLQTCLRCGNHFPGGLNRCTACGLEANKAYQKPEIALPWRGYERQVIKCSSCGFETPDHQARKNKIQKCGQCRKVVYIPSGLYNKYEHSRVRRRRRLPNLLYEISDISGAVFTRLMRGRIRWRLIGVLFLLVLVVVTGLYVYKQQTSQVPVVDPPIKTYYNQIVAIRSRVGNALTEFQNDSGGMPLQSEYDDRRNPTKRNRFILAANRILGRLDISINEVRAIQVVPVGAENYQNKLLNMLYKQQIFYAQLKDSIEQNPNNGANRTDKDWRAMWDSGFKMKEEVRLTSKDEIEAMNNLQSLALRPAQGTKP